LQIQVSPITQQAVDTLVDLVKGDWDTALTRVGVQAPQQGPYRELPTIPTQKPVGPDTLVFLLATPKVPINICARFAKRLGYILSDLHPDFIGAAIPSTVGNVNPIIDAQTKIQESDLMSLRDAAMLLGLILSDIDPSFYSSAMQSRTLNSIADKALYESIVRRDLQGQGITVGRLADGSYVGRVDLSSILGAASELTGGLAGAGGTISDVANIVASAAGPIAGLVDAISSGQFDINQLAGAAANILPAISIAAGALGEQDVAQAAERFGTTASTALERVKGVMSLINRLSKEENIIPAQLGQLVHTAAQQIITRERPVTRELVNVLSEEDLGAIGVQAADLDRSRRVKPKKSIYKKSTIKKILQNLEYVSNSPTDIINIIEDALGQKVARKDAVNALYKVIKQRLGDIKHNRKFKEKDFEKEEAIINIMQEKLSGLKTRRAARSLLQSLLSTLNKYYS
jgi:hypothetical protein